MTTGTSGSVDGTVLEVSPGQPGDSPKKSGGPYPPVTSSSARGTATTGSRAGAAAGPIVCLLGPDWYNEGDVITDADGILWQCQKNAAGTAGTWVQISTDIDNQMRQLRSQTPGLCIGVAGGSKAAGASVVQGGCVNGDHSQAWAQIAIWPYGDYGFLINWHSGRCIDVNGSGLLVQSTCTTFNTNQLWRKYTSGSYWKFQNYVSGKIITVPGGYNTGGLQLDVYADVNAANQKWSILPLV